ncbi:MAG: 30S ribosome-binding factor RbfA [Candidatus Omnitrophota bacterium]|jgi:ribosome-binding factor A
MSRIERVNESVKRELCVIVQREISDPRLEFVSISRVDVSRDLRHAKIFFSVLGDESTAAYAADGFEAAKGFIRRILSQRIQLKFMPELNFIYDKAFSAGIELSEQMERLKNESSTSL